MSKILLIDDDSMVLQLLKHFLENEGYLVKTANTSRDGLELARHQPYFLAIVDLLMPVVDGYEVCRRLRELGVENILVLTDRQDERSVIRALEVGADAYLYKPFELPVLLAKIRTLLRRSGLHTPQICRQYDDGHLHIDLDRRLVELDGHTVQLTATEFRLLAILLQNVGRVVPHEELISKIWGGSKKSGLTSLKLYVYYLRRKIEDQPKDPYYVLAEWGIGYRLREPATESLPEK
ncbi:MAG: DNA-binding response regulator [Chloroflexi bacterium]|nr:MAG: DNA-binding response regulator [Chloroflexota bacterium]